MSQVTEQLEINMFRRATVMQKEGRVVCNATQIIFDNLADGKINPHALQTLQDHLESLQTNLKEFQELLGEHKTERSKRLSIVK